MKSPKHCWCGLGSLATVFFILSGCTDKGQQPINHSAVNDSTSSTSTAKPAQATPLSLQTAHLLTVTIKDMKFDPEVLSIHKGDTVVWVNNDLTNHCVTEAGKKWTSGTIAPDSSWKSVVAENAEYFCAIHVVMKGKISVE